MEKFFFPSQSSMEASNKKMTTSISILEGGPIASQALYKKLGLLPACSILLGTRTACAPKTRVDMGLVEKSPQLTELLGCTTAPTSCVAKVTYLAKGISIISTSAEMTL
jgi:hypothetical protein